ncbi:MAG: ABC transporter ATP-binding protein [Candidatus Theseobacter exili]|nr:ABC transporter ATP-binding protein [Candidatus Theseobacter exili]
MANEIIRVEKLVKRFERKSGFWNHCHNSVTAVDNLDFLIYEGETMGLVGESGCGKTTLGRMLLHLSIPDSGKVSFMGCDLLLMRSRELRKMRKNMQIVFQDPAGSLNSRMRVQEILSEGLNEHYKNKGKYWIKERISEVLSAVGLEKNSLIRYPHEFSGGERQRIGIARALTLHPGFIVCDEPVSALDVSIQAQILNLLNDLKKQYGLTYLFISHDLSVVKHMATKVAIMYLGRFMEMGPSDTVYKLQKHPYTQILISAIPKIDKKNQERLRVSGEVPSGDNIPDGCRFHPRCPYAETVCRTKDPGWKQVGEDHWISCHFVI